MKNHDDFEELEPTTNEELMDDNSQEEERAQREREDAYDIELGNRY